MVWRIADCKSQRSSIFCNESGLSIAGAEKRKNALPVFLQNHDEFLHLNPVIDEGEEIPWIVVFRH
jgi:hypothetical protein